MAKKTFEIWLQSVMKQMTEKHLRILADYLETEFNQCARATAGDELYSCWEITCLEESDYDPPYMVGIKP